MAFELSLQILGLGVTDHFFFEFFGLSPNFGFFLELASNNWNIGSFLEPFLFQNRLTNGQEIFLLGGES